MSLLDLLRARPSESVVRAVPTMPWAEYAEMVGRITAGGSVDAALRNAASWACIDVIADAYSRTPFDAVRKIGNARVPIDPAPRIVAEPSGLVTSDVWLTQVAVSILTDGNAFGQIIGYGQGGYPTQIEMIDPALVTERAVVDGQPGVRVEGERKLLFPLGPIWHVPGRTVLPGSPFGLSPIKYAAKVIGTSLAVEDFSNRFFTDGAHPTVVAMMDADPGKDGAELIKQRIIRSTRGNREPLVFGGGKLERLQAAPGETQFIDLARFDVEQACRFWRVPPSMVYLAISGQNVTYANVTHNDLQLLKYTLEGYYRRIESAWSRCLPRPQIVKANRNVVLAADAKTRHDVYKVRLDARTMTVNEVRALEDEPPFPGSEWDAPGTPPFDAPPEGVAE